MQLRCMGVSAADKTALEAGSRQRSPDSLKHLFKQPLSAVYPYGTPLNELNKLVCPACPTLQYVTSDCCLSAVLAPLLTVITCVLCEGSS